MSAGAPYPRSQGVDAVSRPRHSALQAPFSRGGERWSKARSSIAAGNAGSPSARRRSFTNTNRTASPGSGVTDMNWDVVKGKWKQVKGEARKQWGKLTDSDWEEVAGDK